MTFVSVCVYVALLCAFWMGTIIGKEIVSLLKELFSEPDGSRNMLIALVLVVALIALVAFDPIHVSKLK